MTCKEPHVNCNECKPPAPSPVMPRCNDIVLTDGTYTNSTVVVENGCITSIATGASPLYTPEICCPTSGGGGGGSGVDGEAGADGEAATITIGSIHTVDSTQPAKVINTGSSTHAILDFYLPKGDTGADGEDESGASVEGGGLEFVNGLLASTPVSFPPVMHMMANDVSPGNVELSFSEPDSQNGISYAKLDLTDFESDLKAYINDQIQSAVTPIDARLSSAESTLNNHANQLSNLDSRVTNLGG